jgi:RNA polymerase sigma-70 factor, ECF subfamily
MPAMQSSIPTASCRMIISAGLAAPTASWGAPEERLLATEACELIETTIATLPEAQRQLIALRDVEGFSSEEVCNVLDPSEVNQRVLLHRARAMVRQTLEE